MAESKKMIIVEGLRTEKEYIESLKKNFLIEKDLLNENEDIRYFLLPFGTNIYKIYKEMLKDKEEELNILDVVKSQLKTLMNDSTKEKIIKEEFDFELLSEDCNFREYPEVYLIFDYDGHAFGKNKRTNGNKQLIKMLKYFDNETEKGKLYISYPMIESTLHFKDYNHCSGCDLCYMLIDDCKNYKQTVKSSSKIKKPENISKKDWEFIMVEYIYKIACLTKRNNDVKKLLSDIKTNTIFDLQYKNTIKDKGMVMVLSCIPEFIFDYYGYNTISEVIDIPSEINKNV